MKFILGVFIFFLTVSLINRFFGKQIMRWLIKRFNLWAKKEMEKQSQQYHRHTESGPYKENVYVDQEIKVSVDRSDQRSSKPKLEDIISEDVEFEELNGN